MFDPPLTQSERDELLERAARALAERRDAFAAKDRDLARSLKARSEAAMAEYHRRLPIVAMSVCPFTGQVFHRSFDPFGFDGGWWRDGATRAGPRPPRHFCVLRGAVAYGDLDDEETPKPVRPRDFETETGPEVPYVIPRILEKEGVVAVLGELEMEQGQKVYTIGYFGQPRPPVQDLTADWPNQMFEWVTALGEKGWKPANDPWDFDLGPWIEKGKVRWCAKGSGNERLAPEGPPEECPYLDLPGRREQLKIGKYGVLGHGLPDGEPFSP